MAIMFPWATKEYLLWKMSLAQIILYNNLGSDILSGKGQDDPNKLANKSYEELAEIREELKKQYGDIG